MEPCVVCHGTENVSEMTDGKTSHTVCDACRPLVTTFFHIYHSMNMAVGKVSQAKRGSRV